MTLLLDTGTKTGPIEEILALAAGTPARMQIYLSSTPAGARRITTFPPHYSLRLGWFTFGKNINMGTGLGSLFSESPIEWINWDRQLWVPRNITAIAYDHFRYSIKSGVVAHFIIDDQPA